jgi:hypothetical protein
MRESRSVLIARSCASCVVVVVVVEMPQEERAMLEVGTFFWLVWIPSLMRLTTGRAHPNFPLSSQSQPSSQSIRSLFSAFYLSVLAFLIDD